jgi:hypothetical protein
MSRNLRNVRSLAGAIPTEEVDQINPDAGNGEGSSNTFNGALQEPPRASNNDRNNPGDNQDAEINAQVAAAQAAEQRLRTDVEALQRKQELVDAINQRIL